MYIYIYIIYIYIYIPTDSGDKTKKEDTNAMPQPDSQPMDKRKLTLKLENIVKTAQFAKLWKDKVMEGKQTYSKKNTVVPTEEDIEPSIMADEKPHEREQRLLEFTTKHWTKIASKSDKPQKPETVKINKNVTLFENGAA